MTVGAQHQSTASAGYFLVCIAGPDHGKRLALTGMPLQVGRSPDCNLMSDDPDVDEHFATLYFDGSRLRVHATAPLLPFIDGHPAADGMVSIGQQLRLGRSVWELNGPGAAPSVAGLVNRLGTYLYDAAGVEKPGELNPRKVFADAGKKHTADELESFFTVGSAGTTPPFTTIDAAWPGSWVFARVLGFTMLLYFCFLVARQNLSGVDLNLLPAIIMTGSVLAPLSILVFFFEANAPRNISLYQVIKFMLIGGLTAIVASMLFTPQYPSPGVNSEDFNHWMIAAITAIAEETGKALTLLLVVNKSKYRWTLNGLLLGAAVGTGFTVFDSAGYFLWGLSATYGDSMDGVVRVLAHLNGPTLNMIIEHGILGALAGNALWTGLIGAALWRVRGDRPFERAMVRDPRFLRVLGLCSAMHFIWISPLTLPFYAKYLILGAAAWLLVLGMVQSGLTELRAAQAPTPLA